ncbi:deoxynucleoside kinase [Flaviaesturariibacter amylovorans]|uniref:Deoxynucleoside kinase n=2 Tax=Flaviaesturariibacter amylovorans TaxID=1084520 RepID=A0ABP8HCI1_9BACT
MGPAARTGRAFASVMPKDKQPKHIAIAGNIGAGKTTLTQMLSKHYRWIPQFEDVDDNPYLNDFYEDMPRWSFPLQIYFLNGRLRQLLEIQRGTETVIQDRTIYEDAHIFAPNLHEMSLMTKRDYDNYFTFFQTLKMMVQPPDLLIYLQCSVPTLVGQIQKRGREYEENIRLDYLKRLNDYYNKWIEGYKEGPLLIINGDENKFGEREEDFGKIINLIDAQLYGLF